MKPVRLIIAGALVSWMGIGSAIYAVDWASCGSALDDVRSAADNASDLAQEAGQAKDEFESARDEYQECRQFPEVYDLLKDGCQSQREEAESARENLEVAVQSVTDALDEVDRAMSDVGDSCGHQIVHTTRAQPVPGVSAGNQKICSTLRRSRNGTSSASLMGLCKTVMPETECRACLSAP